jgi:D-alanine-D-alanine ligase
MKKIKIAVLQGGWSSERAVSFMSSEQVIKHLDVEKYDVAVIDVPDNPSNRQWVLDLVAVAPDLVFSVLHGGAGEDGTVQGLLDSLGIKYVGSKVLASAIGMNKQLTRMILQEAGLPVAKGQLLRSPGDKLEVKIPLVVKPNSNGSSVGVTIVKEEKQLADALQAAFAEGEEVLVEELVEGEEITCGVVETSNGLVALDVLKIQPTVEFYDFNAKYHDDSTAINLFQAPEDETKKLQQFALDVFATLGCQGYARTDIIYSPNKTAILEVNTLPGMTSHSLIPKAAASRWSYSDLLDLLIDVELSR